MEYPQRHVVITDTNDGMAHVTNVQVVFAHNTEEAENFALLREGLSSSAKNKMYAVPFSELEDGWAFFG